MAAVEEAKLSRFCGVLADGHFYSVHEWTGDEWRVSVDSTSALMRGPLWDLTEIDDYNNDVQPEYLREISNIAAVAYGPDSTVRDVLALVNPRDVVDGSLWALFDVTARPDGRSWDVRMERSGESVLITLDGENYTIN